MENIKNKIKKVFESKTLVKLFYLIGVLLAISIIFHIGVFVGFHKASFGKTWGENYYRNFGMGPTMMNPRFFDKESIRKGVNNNFNNMGMGYFPNAHGANGKIIKIESPTLIVQDKDNTEKVILLKNDTKIQEGRNEKNTADLKIDDFIVVIGTPNTEGQIEAKLIRIMPNPEFLIKQ